MTTTILSILLGLVFVYTVFTAAFLLIKVDALEKRVKELERPYIFAQKLYNELEKNIAKIGEQTTEG